MALADQLNQRWYDSFVEDAGVTKVRVLGAGGGGGGAVTVADGADVTQGALADAAVVTDANGTLSGKLRGLVKILASVWDSINGRLKVDGSAVTQPVSGTFFQATQPISVASLPLPSGASQEHTTAGSPHSARLSDGAAFYDATKTGQLPSALTASGNLKAAINEAVAAALVSSRQVVGKQVGNDGGTWTIKSKQAAPASSGDNAFIAAVAAKKIRVLQYALQATGTVNVKLQDTNASPVQHTPAWNFQVREGLVIVAPAGSFVFETVAGEGVEVNLSAAVATNVSCVYAEED